MAFKMKGSPMYRNFGIGKSPLEQERQTQKQGQTSKPTTKLKDPPTGESERDEGSVMAQLQKQMKQKAPDTGVKEPDTPDTPKKTTSKPEIKRQPVETKVAKTTKKEKGITVGDVHETLFSGLTKIPTKGSTKVSKKLAEGAKKAGQKVWDKAKQVWNYELTD